MAHASAATVAPVEYAVAVDRYLAEAGLGPSSRRVYRISLTSWAWPLVGKLPPRAGAGGWPGRRRSRWRCWIARTHAGSSPRRVAHRAASAQARTLNRELSALRSAVGWWQRKHWIETDPTAGLQQTASRPVALAPLTSAQRAALFQAPVGLREQALWHLLQDTGASAEALLGLDAGSVDLARRPGQAGRRRTAPVRVRDRRPAQLAARGPPGRPGLPHRPARARRDSGGRCVPVHGLRADVLPAGGGDIHRLDQAARPGRPRLDAAPAAPAEPDARGGRVRYSPESAASSNAVNGVGPTSPTVICAPACATRWIAARNSSAWSALLAPTTRNRHRRTTA